MESVLTIEEGVSGQAVEGENQEFDLRLVDSDGQVMNLDSTSVVQIKQGQDS